MVDNCLHLVGSDQQIVVTTVVQQFLKNVKLFQHFFAKLYPNSVIMMLHRYYDVSMGSPPTT